MKKKLVLSLALVALMVSTVTAQGNNDRANSFPDFDFSKLNPLQNNQIADSLFQWQEHIVLHLDKTKVQPTDYVFFKAYLLTGPEQLRMSASNVLKIELLDEGGNLLRSQYHKIVDGTADGSLKIPKRLKAGNYFFRAYTQWMLNYDAEQLAIKQLQIGKTRGTAKDKADRPAAISAFPEGGNLVAGITNKVVIKSTSGSLTGAKIVDGNGNEVSSITSYGMVGTTIFKPERGASYYISLKEVKIFQMPAVQDKGYSLQVNNLETSTAFIKIEATPELIGKPMILKGLLDEVIYFETEVDFKEDYTAQIEISKAELPKGVLNILLVDEADTVWAQRPIIIEGDDFSITVEKVESSAVRDKATSFVVQVTDMEGKPVQTSLSVSLSGMVEEVRQPLETSYERQGDKNLRVGRYAADLKVLSSKSEDRIAEYGKERPAGKIRYAFQNGLDFYGQAYDLNGKLLINSNIQIILLHNDNAIVKEVTTNSDGLFKLSDMDFKGEAKVVFRTAGNNTKEKLVKVIPYKNETPPLSVVKKGEKNKNSENAEISETISRKSAADFLSEEEEGLIALDEITLVSSKSERDLGPSMYGIKPSRVVVQDSERPKTLPQMFLNVPGFNVADLGGLNPRLILPRSAGMGGLLWVIDGFPLDQHNTLRDMISIVPYTDIDRIEILLGASAAVYGSRAAAGVIVIYTKNGSDEEYFNRKHTQLIYHGYHNSLDFTSYKQQVQPSLRSLKNSDATLYWNPKITTNANGRATIRISIPETFSKLRFGIKGINLKGKKANVQTVITL